MGYLGVKHKVTYKVVLADERRRVLAEVVEYFHY